MALLFLNSGCAKWIHLSENTPESTWCHPFVNAEGVEVGASCDNFLTSNPQTLNQASWVTLQNSWGTTECTNSAAMLNLKVFVEDTCSQVTCDEATKQAFLDRFERLSHLGATDPRSR